MDEELIQNIWKDVNFLKKHKNKDRDEIIRETIDNWLEKRNKKYGFTKDDNHVCSYKGCFETGSIVTIDRENNVYGCLKSGKTHVCNTTSECKSTFVKDGIIICIMSGNAKEIFIDKSKYGNSNTNCQDYNKCEEGFGEGGEEEEGYENKEEEEEDEEEDGQQTKEDMDETFLLENMGDMDMMFLPTTQNFDNWNEEQEVEKHKRQKRKTESPNKNKKKAKTKKKNKDINCLRSEYTKIMEDLLYNKSLRKRINDEKDAAMSLKAQTEMKRYYKECMNQQMRPIKPRADDIYAMYRNEKPLLFLLEYDSERVSYYFKIIYQIWNFVLDCNHYKEQTSKIHFKQHVLGTLYIMSEYGYRFTNKDGEDVTILPIDRYLATYLPKSNELSMMTTQKINSNSYCKNDITSGRNNIKKSICSMTDNKKLELANRIKSILIENG